MRNESGLIPHHWQGVMRTPALVEEEIADRLLRSEVNGVLWGDSRAYFKYVHKELVLKAEVALAAEAQCMIRNGIIVEGKKCEVRIWTKKMKDKGDAAVPRKVSGGKGTVSAPMGRWQAGTPRTTMAWPAQGGPRPQFAAPTELAAMRRSGYIQ